MVQLVRSVLELNGHLVARRPLAGLFGIGSRCSIDPAHRRPVHNADATQVAGGIELSLVEVDVGHAYVIQQSELPRASLCQFALL